MPDETRPDVEAPATDPPVASDTEAARNAPRDAGNIRALVETFEHLELGLAIFDEERRLRHSNIAFREIHSLSPEAVEPGTPFEALIGACTNDPEAGPSVQALFAQHLEPSQTADGDRFEVRREDGQVLDCRCFRLDGGGFAVTCADITGWRAAEQDLRDREPKLRDFAASASEWFWEMGTDLRFAAVSDRFGPRMGLSAECVLG